MEQPRLRPRENQALLNVVYDSCRRLTLMEDHACQRFISRDRAELCTVRQV